MPFPLTVCDIVMGLIVGASAIFIAAWWSLLSRQSSPLLRLPVTARLVIASGQTEAELFHLRCAREVAIIQALSEGGVGGYWTRGATLYSKN